LDSVFGIKKATKLTDKTLDVFAEFDCLLDACDSSLGGGECGDRIYHISTQMPSLISPISDPTSKAATAKPSMKSSIILFLFRNL
jgi:hypothetical protein